MYKRNSDGTLVQEESLTEYLDRKNIVYQNYGLSHNSNLEILKTVTNSEKLIEVYINNVVFFIDLENWNLVSNGIVGGVSGLVTNLEWLFGNNKIRNSREDLCRFVESVVFRGSFEQGCKVLVREDGADSIISRVLNKGETNYDSIVSRECIRYMDLIGRFREEIGRFEVDESVFVVPICPVVNELNMYLRGFYSLLRSVDRHLGFLYLKKAPSLYHKFLKSLIPAERVDGNDVGELRNLVSIVKDFAYTQEYLPIVRAVKETNQLSEDFVDLGNILNRISKGR